MLGAYIFFSSPVVNDRFFGALCVKRYLPVGLA
jgi:hypothetical protein